jgi:hypothetical protein
MMPTTLPFTRRGLAQIKSDNRDSDADRFINYDLLLVLGFCGLGLVVTINVLVCFPDLAIF